MARRGQFGRLPRAVPSLTATIVSIAEQMLADQDRNIMDAWQNGGTYEGRPVTDKMVLEHWQQRLHGVSRSDPLYDTYKNNVQQLQYKIAYSKQYTHYLQGGRTDNMGMAKFFTDWEKKVPRNSEFYRQLQQDAAGYVNLARSAARAGAAQAKVDNFNRRRGEIDRQYILPATIIDNAATNYARANGLIGNNQSLESLQPGQTAVFYDLLANADDKTFLYNGPGGNPVTVGDVRNQVHKVSPDLRFGFTADDINRINLRAVKGSTMEIKLARQNGYSDWTTHYQSQREQFGSAARDSGIMTVEQQYVTARETFNVEWNDPTTSVEDKAKAWETYQRTLLELAGKAPAQPTNYAEQLHQDQAAQYTVAPAADANTRARLIAEANGDSTKNSLAEDVFGLGGPPGTPPSALGTPPPNVGDIANVQMQVKLAEEQKQMATDGTGVWTNGDITPVTNPSGQVTGYTFTPSATGTVVGLTNDPAEIQKLTAVDANGQFTGPVVTLSSPWGGQKDVHLHTVNVYANVAATGTTNNAAPGTLVAQATTIVINGIPQTSYLYVNGGQTWKTPYAPWSSQLPMTRDPKTGDITIDATALNATGSRAVELAKDPSGNFALTIANIGRVDANTVEQNPDGTIKSVIDPKTGQRVNVDQGQLATALVTNVPAAIYATDPTRAAGPSPTEDFKTWTQSMLEATPGGQQEYDKLVQDQGFQQKLATEIAANSVPPGSPAGTPPNANVQAAANLQAFGGSVIPGFDKMADTALGQHFFNWLLNRPAQDTAANSSPAAVVNKAAPQPFVSPLASVYNYSAQTVNPKPVEIPSLQNLGSYANGFDTLTKLGLAPPAASPKDYAFKGGPPPPVQIAPANIKVPEPPPAAVPNYTIVPPVPVKATGVLPKPPKPGGAGYYIGPGGA